MKKERRIQIGGWALLALLPALASATGPSLDNAQPFDCEKGRDKMLAELISLREKSKQVTQECRNNINRPANANPAFREKHKKYKGQGDCEITYLSTSRFIDGVESSMSRACDLVNDGKALAATCNQADCMKLPGEKFKLAAEALEKANYLLKRGRKNVAERMLKNADAAEQYADFLKQLAADLESEIEERRLKGLPLEGEFSFSPAIMKMGENTYGVKSPSEIVTLSNLPFDPKAIRHAANTITGTFKNDGDGTGLDKFSSEQYGAYRQGKSFISYSEKLETKLETFNTKLGLKANQMVTTGNRMGSNPSGSNISGGKTPSLAGETAPMGAIASPGSATPRAGSGPSRAGSLASDPHDDELFASIEDDVAAEKARLVSARNRKGTPTEVNEASKGLEQSSERKKIEEAKNSGGQANFYSSSTVINSAEKAEIAQDLDRAPASSKDKAPSSLTYGGQGLASEKGDGKNAKAQEADETLKEYAASSSSVGTKKALMRNGPSLRDLLREKLDAKGNGASTRAMHDVLGEMSEQSEIEAAQRREHGEISETLSSQEDIKGADSEALFVRVRAAHLRFQRISPI